MFGRRSSDPATDATASSETKSAAASTDSASSSTTTSTRDATAPKGRPTPTRKEAEAARKQAIRVPRDPKAAKAAERERSRELRAKQAEALRGGDERYLPVRDKGPVKKYARDWVDSRFQLASFFLPVAVIILLTGFLRLNTSVATVVRNVELVILIGMLLTTGFTYFVVGRDLKKQYPDPADRKGAAMYAVMRSAMPRRMRQPRPTVKYGGGPVEPKAAKEPKAPKNS